jgi:asparagine synthase (glutamine-hydrolysing)
MDSSSVAAAAALIAGRPPELYSVTYGFSEYDETAGIEPLVRHLGSRWHNVVAAQPPLFDLIGRIVTQTGQPLVTVTWLSHYLLAQQAAGDGAQALFSGLGGDENLAGEYEHFLYFFADLKQAGQSERLAEEVAAWIRLHDHPIFRKNWMVVQDVFDRLVDLDSPGRVRLDERRYRANWAWFNDDFLASGPQTALPVNPFSSYLTNRCYQDLVFETTPPCLAADNANAAQFGLVTRFPFLDPHLVRFCYSLPGTLKYSQGVTKAVMRRAMAGMLPEENIRNTTKTGFNAPAGDWLAGPARADLMDLFGSRSFKERGWLKPGSADRLVRQHLSGQANHMMLLWQLINAELWLRSLAENGGTASR